MKNDFNAKIKIFNNFCNVNDIDKNLILNLYNNLFEDSNIIKKDFLHRMLENKLNEEDKEYVNSRLKNAKNMDWRTPIEFACELALSWLWEDCIALKYNAELIGCDKSRNFLTNTKQITSTPDLIINNKKVEIVIDYTGFVENNNKLDLRCSKYDTLMEQNSNVLICTPSGNTILLDLNTIKIKRSNYHRIWKKPFVRLFLED